MPPVGGKRCFVRFEVLDRCPIVVHSGKLSGGRRGGATPPRLLCHTEGWVSIHALCFCVYFSFLQILKSLWY